MAVSPFCGYDGVALYHADALALSQAQADASVDVVFTDPPYFRVKDEPWDRAWDTEAGFLAWLGRLLDEWRRILKPNGSLYVFAAPERATAVEREVGTRFRVLNNVRWLKEDGWHQKQERAALRSFLSPWEAIVFAEQRGCDDCSGRGRVPHSAIAHLVQQIREEAGLSRVQVDEACAPAQRGTGLCYRWEAGDCVPTAAQFAVLCELAGVFDPTALYDRAVRPFHVPAGDHGSDMWRFGTVAPAAGKHPCEKPSALVEYALRRSARPGAVVFDPFSGSGVVLLTARRLGMRAIGGDASAHWCRYAADRLSQGSLFATEAA